MGEFASGRGGTDPLPRANECGGGRVRPTGGGHRLPRNRHGVIAPHPAASGVVDAATPGDGEWIISDGDLSLRAFEPEDEAALLAGRDDEWARWFGPGHTRPRPTACIVVAEQVVGWVDADPDLAGLRPGETNLGYNVFPPHRGLGHATRAVQLMLRRLAAEGVHTTAILRINELNRASRRVAVKAGFARIGEIADSHVYSRVIE